MRGFRLAVVFILLALANLISVAAQESAPVTSGDAVPITITSADQIEALASLSGDVKAITISPDSSMIAVASQHEDYDYGIDVYDLATGREISALQGRMDGFYDLDWSPDSKRIAVISQRVTGGGAEVWSVKTYTVALGTNLNFYTFGHSDAWYSDVISSSDTPSTPVKVGWSPDSSMIAIAFNERLDIDDGKAKTPIISEPIKGVQSMAWTSDNKFIITRSVEDKSDQFRVTLWGIRVSSS